MAGRAYGLHECAAKGCSARVDVSELMCQAHWRNVPRDVQRRVYSAWEAYHAPVGDGDVEAIALRAAQREAVEVVAKAEGWTP